jgi:hypothetical protein
VKRRDRRPGITNLNVLVVVDATEPSRRALQYVGRVLADRDRVDYHLAYIAPHLPPALLES